MRLKFVCNSVGMVAYSHLLGESSTLILIALTESDSNGRKNYRENLRIITRSTSKISNDTQSPSEY